MKLDEARQALENDKEIIEKNMQMINWVYQDKKKHPFIKKRNKKIDKYRQMKLVKPKKIDENVQK